ncbi:MAG: cysteine--tRNA ligase [Rickettsiaceae bacterium H1]|nr:cysteine--tRNA ligase [Rickettsiaceae bacterium H1]
MKLYNTLQNTKADFVPLNDENVRLYVCGPTIYNFPHIGNARSVIVYDLLFRVLLHLYKKVTYVRNITDVDDKIISAADKEGKSIKEITDYYTDIFHKNMKSLACLNPTFEPKATNHINDIILFIEKLLKKKHAYIANGSVYFNISSYSPYGKLSGRKQSDLIAGNRIEIDDKKHNPGDFTLWKSTDKHGWNSPWGYGRPGWHIECSAMSILHLGNDFDIHGGGSDLQFPHHENEIAQSCSAYPESKFANYWVHNGFVLVNGKKMSKSLGNVLTVQDLIKTGIEESAIRYSLLSTHYRKPLNWTKDLLRESTDVMNKFFAIVQDYPDKKENLIPDREILNALCDDLNIAKAITIMHQYAGEINNGNKQLLPKLAWGLNFLGLSSNKKNYDENYIEKLIDNRNTAKQNKDFAKADKIRKELAKIGIELLDGKEGKTTWRSTLKFFKN